MAELYEIKAQQELEKATTTKNRLQEQLNAQRDIFKSDVSQKKSEAERQAQEKQKLIGEQANIQRQDQTQQSYDERGTLLNVGAVNKQATKSMGQYMGLGGSGALNQQVQNVQNQTISNLNINENIKQKAMEKIAIAEREGIQLTQENLNQIINDLIRQETIKEQQFALDQQNIEQQYQADLKSIEDFKTYEAEQLKQQRAREAEAEVRAIQREQEKALKEKEDESKAFIKTIEKTKKEVSEAQEKGESPIDIFNSAASGLSESQRITLEKEVGLDGLTEAQTNQVANNVVRIENQQDKLDYIYAAWYQGNISKETANMLADQVIRGVS